jgi:hypothetical protein
LALLPVTKVGAIIAEIIAAIVSTALAAKEHAIVLYFLALLVLANPAAAQQCLPEATCCTMGFCGTLEQFQRAAQIACSTFDAIENKNSVAASQALDRCFQLAATTREVADAQQTSAKIHKRAEEARRKLQEMGTSPVAPPHWVDDYCKKNDAWTHYGSSEACIRAWSRDPAGVAANAEALRRRFPGNPEVVRPPATAGGTGTPLSGTSRRAEARHDP